jgi:hypothetical protein
LKALGFDAARSESFENAAGYFLNSAKAINFNNQLSVRENFDEWRGLIGVDVEAVANNVFGVVGATLFNGSVEKAANNFVGVGGDLNHGTEAFAVVGQNSV